jgi:ParB family chromosome partitioning protein
MPPKPKPERASYIGSQIEQFEQQQQALTENLNFQKIELIERSRIQDLTYNGHTMHNRISYSKLVFLELVESIKEISKNGGGICGTGLLNPIMLRRNGSRLEIIHGRNRLDALIYMNSENVPCVVCDNISDELARYMRTSENINRDNLNPFDETLSILEYIQISCGFTNLDAVKSFINKIKNFSTGKISTLSNEEILLNGNVSAVLKKIGKYDITTFANRLSILNLNEKLVQAIKDERIDYTRAKIINSKLKDEEKIIKIIDYVEKNKLSSKKLSEYIEEEFLMTNKNKKDEEVFSFINDIKDVRKKISSIKDKEKQAFVNEKMLEIEKLYSLIKEQIN